MPDNRKRIRQLYFRIYRAKETNQQDEDEYFQLTGKLVNKETEEKRQWRRQAAKERRDKERKKKGENGSQEKRQAVQQRRPRPQARKRKAHITTIKTRRPCSDVQKQKKKAKPMEIPSSSDIDGGRSVRPAKLQATKEIGSYFGVPPDEDEISSLAGSVEQFDDSEDDEDGVGKSLSSSSNTRTDNGQPRAVTESDGFGGGRKVAPQKHAEAPQPQRVESDDVKYDNDSSPLRSNGARCTRSQSKSNHNRAPQASIPERPSITEAVVLPCPRSIRSTRSSISKSGGVVTCMNKEDEIEAREITPSLATGSIHRRDVLMGPGLGEPQGHCTRCNIRTRDEDGLPITDEHAHDGVCIRCNISGVPLDVYWKFLERARESLFPTTTIKEETDDLSGGTGTIAATASLRASTHSRSKDAGGNTVPGTTAPPKNDTKAPASTAAQQAIVEAAPTETAMVEAYRSHVDTTIEGWAATPDPNQPRPSTPPRIGHSSPAAMPRSIQQVPSGENSGPLGNNTEGIGTDLAPPLSTDPTRTSDAASGTSNVCISPAAMPANATSTAEKIKKAELPADVQEDQENATGISPHQRHEESASADTEPSIRNKEKDVKVPLQDIKSSSSADSGRPVLSQETAHATCRELTLRFQQKGSDPANAIDVNVRINQQTFLLDIVNSDPLISFRNLWKKEGQSIKEGRKELVLDYVNPTIGGHCYRRYLRHELETVSTQDLYDSIPTRRDNGDFLPGAAYPVNFYAYTRDKNSDDNDAAEDAVRF